MEPTHPRTPGADYLLLLVAALAPVVAFEFFGRAVAGILDVPFLEDPGEGMEGTMSMDASLAAWGARIAWSTLAVVTVVWWCRRPTKRAPRPVDPEVFE